MTHQAMNFRTFSSLEEAAEYHSGNVVEHAPITLQMEEGAATQQQGTLQIHFDETQEFTAEEFERIMGKLEGIDINGVTEISAEDIGIAPVQARPEITGEIETRDVSGKILKHQAREPQPNEIFSAEISDGQVSQTLINQIMAQAPPAPAFIPAAQPSNAGAKGDSGDFRTIEFRAESLGFSVNFKNPVGLWQVVKLSSNKQAEKKRVQVGWTVFKINGRLVDEAFKDEARNIMTSKEKCTITFDTTTKDLKTIRFRSKQKLKLHLDQKDEKTYGRVLKASKGSGIFAGAILIGVNGKDFEIGDRVSRSDWSKKYFTFDISEEMPQPQPAAKTSSIFGNLSFSWNDFTMTHTVADDTTIAM